MPDYLTLYLPLPTSEAGVGGPGPTMHRVGSSNVTLNPMPEAALSNHLRGLSDYATGKCLLRDEDFLARIQRVRACVGLVIEPRLDQVVRAWAFAMARRTGGFVFDGAAFVDGEDTVLAGPPPALPAISDAEDASPSADEPVDAPVPADANGVRIRAWALMAVIQRAFLEDPSITVAEFAEHHADLSRWIAERGLGQAFDIDELNLLNTPQGALDSQRASNATWLTEGLGVLGWALGVAELRSHDEEFDLFALHDTLGFLDDVPPALDPPRLRPRAELEHTRGQLLAIHWRLREYRLRPGPLDFKRVAARLSFGDSNLDGITLAGGDLAVHGRPIDSAPPDAVQHIASIALERHRAIEWVADSTKAYADVDTST